MNSHLVSDAEARHICGGETMHVSSIDLHHSGKSYIYMDRSHDCTQADENDGAVSDLAC